MFVAVTVVACLVFFAQVVGLLVSTFFVGVFLIVAGIVIALKSRNRLPPKSDAQVIGCLVAVLVAVLGATLVVIAAQIAQALLDD